MSTCFTKEIRCPSCAASKETAIWPGIDREQNEDLREQILNESLFLWKCPECGYEMQLIYPCMYQDRENRFVVFLEPNEKDPVFRTRGVELPDGIRRRLVSSIEELKEKILIFEASLNDAAVELAKLGMENVVRTKKGLNPQRGYFCQADEVQNTIEFVFFFDEETEPLYQSTRLDIYRTTLHVVQSLRFDECSRDFLLVKPDTAQLLLDAYHNWQETKARRAQEPEESGEPAE